MKLRICCEEWQPLPIGRNDGLRDKSDIELLLRTWQSKTGLSPKAFFERRHDSLVPKSWSGTIDTPRFQLEVAPIGSSFLSSQQKKSLDCNLSHMVAWSFSSHAFAGMANVSLSGYRHEALLSLFCDELLLARRRQVIRRYSSCSDSLLTPKGRIAFPAQCYETIRRPNSFVCNWVTLTEDTPENRIFKETLQAYRHRCAAFIRSKVDICLAEMGSVSRISDLNSEYAKIRVDRLPDYYKNLLTMSEALLIGRGSGLFLGNFFASAQILFTANLFEKYSAKIFSLLSSSHGFITKEHPRGAFLFHREKGGAFEQIPDILLSDFSGSNKVIIDTKWKSIDTSKKGCGISPDDLNQIIVYGMRYNCNRIILLYPDITISTGTSGFIEEIEMNLSTQFKVYVAKMPLLSESSQANKNFIDRLLAQLASVYKNG